MQQCVKYCVKYIRLRQWTKQRENINGSIKSEQSTKRVYTLKFGKKAEKSRKDEKWGSYRRLGTLWLGEVCKELEANHSKL